MTPSTTIALLAALYHYKDINDDDEVSEAEEAIEMESEEAIQRPADDNVLAL